MFLAGCTGLVPTPVEPMPAAIIDRSPFTGLPCSAPCWHGLVIGKSSQNEVRSILPTLPFLNQNTVKYVPQVDVSGLTIDAAPPGTLVYADCVRPPQPCLKLTAAGDILARIDITLNYQISAGEAIADLGAPDYVGYQVMGAETVTCQVELVWSSKQLVLNSVPDSWDSSNPKDDCVMVQNTGKTRSNLRITGISYQLTPWLERTLAQGGSEFFDYSGTIPSP